MTQYGYGQLEELWIKAGGSQSLAPLMAAIALAESGGNPDANNYTDNNGTQTSWGLWQVSNGTHSMPVNNINDPLVNAQQAVQKYDQQGLSAWGTYDSGAYQKYYQGNVPPSSLPQGGPGSNAAAGQQYTTTASTGLDVGSALKEMGELFHGAAQGLNWFFWLWQPGQGWRLVMGVGGVASGWAAFKLYTSPSVAQEKSAAFSGAILFTGLSLLAFYMTLRAWPVNQQGKTLRPAAYAVMILTGQHPEAGPPPADNTEAIQGGLEVIASIWIVNKAASSISGLAGAAGVLGGIWAWISKAFKNVGSDIPDVPVESLTVPTGPGGTTPPGTQTV